VRHNNIMDGNADVGIYVEADGVLVDNNRVFESGPDGYDDIGIGDYGTPGSNTVTNNKARGGTSGLRSAVRDRFVCMSRG